MTQEHTTLLIAGTPWSVDVWRDEGGEAHTAIRHSGGYAVTLAWGKLHGEALHEDKSGAAVQVPLDIIDRAEAFEAQAVAMFDDDGEAPYGSTEPSAAEQLEARAQVAKAREAERGIIEREPVRVMPVHEAAMNRGAWIMYTVDDRGDVHTSDDWPEGVTIAQAKRDGLQGFRLLDDDRNVYFVGFYYDWPEGAEKYDGDTAARPLDEFGAPDSGATALHWQTWEEVIG